MASPNDVPRVAEPIAGSGGFVTRAWLDFFLKLASTESQADLAALYAALAARVAELEDNEGFSFQIIGQGAVSVNGTPQPGGFVVISLDNDVDNPGNTMYYGTGPTGERGWFPVSGAMLVEAGQLTKTVGPNGVTTFGLADVADSGAGTLLATTFDAKGRKTGSRAATITGTTNQITVSNGDAAAGLPTLSLAPAVITSLGKADTALQPGADHNTQLSGLQGGSLGQYYHLTSSQVSQVNASVQSVNSGPGVTVDNTDPRNPILSVTGASFTGKNKLINGNFDFFQRGNVGFYSNSTVEGYTADRWVAGTTGGTGNWGIGTASPGTLPNVTRFFGFNLTAVSGAAPTAYIGQKIESVLTLSNTTATVSFWARSTPSAKKVGVRIIQQFGSGGSPSADVEVQVGVITLTSSFQRYSLTFSVPSISGKTLGSNGNDNLFLVLDYCNPTKYSGQLSGQLGLFEVAQVQLEEGASSTDFDLRPLAQELLLCQRYYEKSYNLTTFPGAVTDVGQAAFFLFGLPNANYSGGTSSHYKATKRSNPAVTLYSPATGLTGRVYNAGNASDVTASAVSIGQGGFFVNSAAFGPTVTINLRWQWTADAEI